MNPPWFNGGLNPRAYLLCVCHMVSPRFHKVAPERGRAGRCGGVSSFRARKKQRQGITSWVSRRGISHSCWTCPIGSANTHNYVKFVAMGSFGFAKSKNVCMFCHTPAGVFGGSLTEPLAPSLSPRLGYFPSTC